MTITRHWLWAALAAVLLSGSLQAQAPLGRTAAVLPQMADTRTDWTGLAVSMAAHAAASGFDSWTSWNKLERNGFLADNGRFGASRAYKKAGIVAGVSVAEALIVKKWGRRHPWLERAFKVANFTSAGMMVSAGVHNLGNR
jgi:hypothetical protein